MKTLPVKSSLLFYIVCITFKGLLDFSYINFISVLYSYLGFDLNYNKFNYLISWLLTLILIVFIPKRINKISDFFLMIYALNILLPMLSLYGLNSELEFTPVAIHIISFYIIIIAMKIRVFNQDFIYPYIRNGDKIFKYLSYSLIIYLIIWYIISGAAFNFNLDILKVYEFRDLNAELTSLGILTYINSWILKVISLALIAYTLLKKQYKILILLILTQIFFYGVSSHKSVLFSPLIVFGIYFYLKKTTSLLSIPVIFCFLILVSLYSFLYNNDPLYGSLFMRRVLFVPNYLSFVYYDYFTHNPFAYWTNNFPILGPPVYPEGISLAIGNYMNFEGMRANNGFISMGFAQGGYLGIFLYLLILIIILKTLNNISSSVSFIWFPLSIVALPLWSLTTSADILTTLLTHGLFISILLLLLLRQQKNHYEY